MRIEHKRMSIEFNMRTSNEFKKIVGTFNLEAVPSGNNLAAIFKFKF